MACARGEHSLLRHYCCTCGIVLALPTRALTLPDVSSALLCSHPRRSALNALCEEAHNNELACSVPLANTNLPPRRRPQGRDLPQNQYAIAWLELMGPLIDVDVYSIDLAPKNVRVRLVPALVRMPAALRRVTTPRPDACVCDAPRTYVHGPPSAHFKHQPLRATADGMALRCRRRCPNSTWTG